MSRYRLSIHLHFCDKPPVIWRGAFSYDGHGIQLECQDLPQDVIRAVLSGLNKDCHWGGCQMADGRYITYAGRAA
jgi:hypothetical protein